MIKLGYNNADWLLTWKIDGLFNLTSKQKDFVEDRLEHHLEWHRQNELPIYSELIDETISKIEDGISEQDYDWVINQMQAAYKRTLLQILPDAATLLMELSPNQIEYYQARMSEKNESFAEFIALPPEEQIKKRNENIINEMEEWFGDLNDEQKEKVSELASTLPLRYLLFNEDRLRRQNEFIELLQARLPREEFVDQLKTFLINFEDGRSDEYKNITAEFNEAARHMTIAIDNMLNPEQKNHAFERVRDYQMDIIELALGE